MYVISGERLHDFDIKIGNDNFNPEDVSTLKPCTHYDGTAGSSEVLRLACDAGNMIGRYVFIQIPGEKETLTLCEVEVYGGQYNIPPSLPPSHLIIIKKDIPPFQKIPHTEENTPPNPLLSIVTEAENCPRNYEFSIV